METRSAKRKKLWDQENGVVYDEGGEDRISELPDAILHQILFLLPIRSVAQTSILSKRWRYIWLHFPDLDFTTLHNPNHNTTNNNTNPLSNSLISYTNSNKRVHQSPVAARKGLDFISQVLSLRDKHSDVRILRFRAKLISFSRLNGLIRCAVRHNVQELDIEVATNDYFNFPRSVLSSDSLRFFRLKSNCPGFRLPPSMIMRAGFRSLHSLSLSLIILYDQPSLLDLFTDSSFPLLKKLSLDACFGLKHLGIGCRSLEDLTLENCFQLDDLDISGSKLVKLRVAGCFDGYSTSSCVKIVAPRLRIIFWSYNAITENSSLMNLTSLHEASVGFFILHEELTATKLWSVSNFLSGLSNARNLTLESQCVQILSKNNHFAAVFLSPFDNIKSLELHTGFNRHNISGLANLFRSCPMIHTLIMKIMNDDDIKAEARRQWNRDLWESSSSGEERYWESQTQALKAFLQHLKVVKFHGFSECESDVSLVKFLLKHGRALQEMTICFGLQHHHANSSRDSLRRDKIKSQMTGFSSASSNATIVFL